MSEHQLSDRADGPHDDQQILDYLLDRMPPETRGQFEDRMMADAGLFDLVEATEEDLLLRYTRGAVPSTERPAIEQAYSTPSRLARLAEARAISEALDAALPTAQKPEPWWKRMWMFPGGSRLIVAGAACAAMFFIVYTLSRDPVAAPVPKTPIVLWTVTAGRDRGAADAAASFDNPGQGLIRMSLPGAACTAGSSCRLEITDIDSGSIRWSGELSYAGAAWSADIPAGALVPGDYIGEAIAAGGGKSSHQFRVR